MLLAQYKKARKGLNDMIKNLGETERDIEDKKMLNSMKNEVEYIIKWLKIGHDPENPQGTNIRYAYDITQLSNMDLLPDLSDEIKKERVPLQPIDEQLKKVIKLMEMLSDRERDCFILRVAQNMTLQEVADELDISISSVQTYLERVDKKIKEVVS